MWGEDILTGILTASETSVTSMQNLFISFLLLEILINCSEVWDISVVLSGKSYLTASLYFHDTLSYLYIYKYIYLDILLCIFLFLGLIYLIYEYIFSLIVVAGYVFKDNLQWASRCFLPRNLFILLKL